MAYKSGEWNLICDVCGKKIKSGQAKKRWDGFIVCPEDYETRHTMDFIKVRKERGGVPFSRPEPADTYVSVTYADTGSYYCTPISSQGLADTGVADCARADISGHHGDL